MSRRQRLLQRFCAAFKATCREGDEQRLAEREEAARLHGELDAARRIQLGLLPDIDRLFVGEQRFSLAALLEPAQAVGGDYYDCFMLDARHLCLVIGDVSGKGLPASLFMAIAKTLTGTLARQGASLSEVAGSLQRELGRANPEYLFVTAFMAILDVDSGELEYLCAGHDTPVRLSQGVISRLDPGEQGGPPICAVSDYPFATCRTRLRAGDLLCFFTDGITEASNGQQMFGSAGLERSLGALAGQAVGPLVHSLRATVRQFEAGQPPVDDLTLLLVRWHGPAQSSGDAA